MHDVDMLEDRPPTLEVGFHLDRSSRRGPLDILRLGILMELPRRNVRRFHLWTEDEFVEEWSNREFRERLAHARRDPEGFDKWAVMGSFFDQAGRRRVATQMAEFLTMNIRDEI